MLTMLTLLNFREWYEEEEEEPNDEFHEVPTNAETIFAQRRKSSCKVDTMFTFNQVQTKVAEISTLNHKVPPLAACAGAEPVWLSTDEMMSLKLEMAKTSTNYIVSDSTDSNTTTNLATVKVIDQPVILTCAKKRRSDEASTVAMSQQETMNCSVEGKLFKNGYLLQ